MTSRIKPFVIGKERIIEDLECFEFTLCSHLHLIDEKMKINMKRQRSKFFQHRKRDFCGRLIDNSSLSDNNM